MELHLDNLPHTIAINIDGGVPEVVMIDQRKLPAELEYVRTSDWRTLIDAIKTMVVRGAPALGIVGAAVVMLRAFEFVAARDTAPAELAACPTNENDAFACLMCQRRKNELPCETLDAGLEGAAEAVSSGAEAASPAAQNAASAESAASTSTSTTFNPQEVLCEAMDAHRTFVLDKKSYDPELFMMALEFAGDMAIKARPTAINLSWGVKKALKASRDALKKGSTAIEVATMLLNKVRQLLVKDEVTNRRIGGHGATILSYIANDRGKEQLNVLTYCNAGSLATAFYGTGLGVLYAAAEQGLLNQVYACETRPVLQGSRLTVWELAQAGVPVTVLCDNMVATLMAAGKVDAVVVGADRIAANGDVANKIGTFGVALLAHHFKIPVIVAAPESTIDKQTKNGAHIEIEYREATEVMPQMIEGVEVFNPSFDVTPYKFVTAIVTQRGLWMPRGTA
jgi:methylthioribose-1-phosphate isomerase